MTTIENLMALAADLENAASDYAHDCATAIELKILNEAREALRAALTEALAAQPVREPLSDEQIRNLSGLPECMYGDYLQSFPFARAIERAHGIGGDK